MARWTQSYSRLVAQPSLLSSSWDLVPKVGEGKHHLEECHCNRQDPAQLCGTSTSYLQGRNSRFKTEFLKKQIAFLPTIMTKN